MPKNPTRVCAVITEETTEAARAALQRAASVADIAEIRLDYLQDFDFANPENLRALLHDKPLPVIITCRAVSEGGRQQIEDDVRLRLLVEGSRGMADYCDVEAAYYAQAARLKPDLSRLIVSYHNFEGTPQDLDCVYERLRELPSAIYKIATRARSVRDTLSTFRLLDRAAHEGVKLIALAMEEPGLITRLLGPGRGSFLTYAALAKGRESAPGQPDCRTLRDLYRIHDLSRDTIITGIIGNPVTHSASPAMHNAAFRDLELDFVYLPMEVDDVADFFARFVRAETEEIAWKLRGLSVTIPHKTSVMPLLDDVDTIASEVGAVNTVVVEGGRITGYNTDAQGAIEPLTERLSLKGESCGVIGSGGAARAVVYGLARQGANVTVFARNMTNARWLAASFDVSASPIESLESSDARIIINTTPVGMRGHSEGQSPVPRAAFRNRRIAYDLVYNPTETSFLKFAREEGCETIGGLEMLIAQAALQFKLWTGVEPSIEVMKAAALDKVTGDYATS